MQPLHTLLFPHTIIQIAYKGGRTTDLRKRDNSSHSVWARRLLVLRSSAQPEGYYIASHRGIIISSFIRLWLKIFLRKETVEKLQERKKEMLHC